MIDEYEINGHDLLTILDYYFLENEFRMKRMVIAKVLREIQNLREDCGYVDAKIRAMSMARSERSEKSSVGEQISPFRVIFITLMGSFDDCILQMTMLEAETMTWYQLIVGVGLASALIALICVFITKLGPLARIVQKLPVYIVIGLLAIYSWIG